MQTTFIEVEPAASLWTRCDPRWKLAGILVMLLVVAITITFPVALVTLALAVLAGVSARLPLRWWLDRLPGVAFFLLLVLSLVPLTVPGDGWGPFSSRGFALAALLAAKMLAALTWSFLLMAT